MDDLAKAYATTAAALRSEVLPVFDALVKRSHSVPYKFPTVNNRLSNVCKSEVRRCLAVFFARGTRIVLHATVIPLLKNFLHIKCTTGSAKEKAVYAGMTVPQFVERLVFKRPLMFMTSNDLYLLRDGQNGCGKKKFDAIGTFAEATPIVLRDLLSYDEMAVSALLGVSVPTFFINEGSRRNCARLNTDAFVDSGCYVAQVGTRFERKERMACKHLLVTPTQNVEKNGYGTKCTSPDLLLVAWARFYECPEKTFLTYDEVRARVDAGETRWIPLPLGNAYFDKLLYKNRMRRVLETFLCEANARAKSAAKMAYCHLVGLGLGVWAVSGKTQARLYIEAIADIVRSVALKNVATIDFSWFPGHSKCGGVSSGGKIEDASGNRIEIKFSKRNPAEKLTASDASKLLVAQYAWDGNSYPGNEYWDGALSASGDPAAACCSLISELQNPDVNPDGLRGLGAAIFGDGKGSSFL